MKISQRVKNWEKDFEEIHMYGVPLTEADTDDLKATIVFMTRNPDMLFLLKKNKENDPTKAST